MTLFIIATVYQVAQLIAFPFLLLFLLYKEIRYSPVIGDLTQRLGFVPKNKLAQKNVIWLHAVSVGEVLSIEALIKQIKLVHNDAIIYLTTGTTAGKKIAAKQLPTDYLSLMPYDFLFPMLLAFKRIQPTSIIVVEAEIWPNLLLIAQHKTIPTYLLNARMNRSYKLYKYGSFFFAPILKIFTHIFTQSKKDTQKFLNLGISQNNISVLGNIKAFNVMQKQKEYLAHTTLATDSFAQHTKNYKTLLVGSIHPRELKIYLTMFCNLKAWYPQLKLILAPRHFHWREELIASCNKTGFNTIMLTEQSAQRTPSILQNNEADIILICELGELFKLYPYADIFYLGGTFVPIGGHNLLEPAVWANPTIIGPWYRNCHPISEKLEARHALIKVKNGEELEEETKKLLDDEQRCTAMGTAALDWLKQESEASSIILTSLIKNLN